MNKFGFEFLGHPIEYMKPLNFLWRLENYRNRQEYFILSFFFFLDKQNSNSHVAMDVGERCFNLDFVIKFMRGELWERNKGEILKNCFPRLPRDLNLRFINHNGRKAVLLKKTSSRAVTFPFPPFFLFSFLHRFRRILSEFEKTIDPNRPVSPRIAKVAIIADRDGARPWDYSLQTPNCQRVEWLTTSLARTCATNTL